MSKLENVWKSCIIIRRYTQQTVRSTRLDELFNQMMYEKAQWHLMSIHTSTYQSMKGYILNVLLLSYECVMHSII